MTDCLSWLGLYGFTLQARLSWMLQPGFKKLLRGHHWHGWHENFRIISESWLNTDPYIWSLSDPSVCWSESLGSRKKGGTTKKFSLSALGFWTIFHNEISHQCWGRCQPTAEITWSFCVKHTSLLSQISKYITVYSCSWQRWPENSQKGWFDTWFICNRLPLPNPSPRLPIKQPGQIDLRKGNSGGQP